MLKRLRLMYTAMCDRVKERGIIFASSRGEAADQLRERGCEQIRVKRTESLFTRLLGGKSGGDV